ncbi:MAG: NAD-dependent dehydratase, partial [Planctomycetota bacterium]
LLGNRPEAYGQVWHAVTSKEPFTGEDFVRTACEVAGRPYAIQVAPRWMLALMGLFVPVLRENMEMLYQFEHDYRFDSTKAERFLGIAATPYRAGITAMLRD